MIRPFFLLVIGATASPGLAQDAAPISAEQAAAAAQEAYGPPDPRTREECERTARPGEIVVCAQPEDPEKYRVRSSADRDPAADKSGVPRAPDLYNLPQPAMVGIGVSAKGCFIPPCPAPMPLLIDLAAIPEAPPGSDADRVSKGLAPRGDANGDTRALTPPESASPEEAPSS